MTEPTVFLVDDDQAARQSIIQILDANGIAVEAHSASRMLLTTCDPSRSGCFILGMRIGGMDGVRLYRCLAGIGWRLPYIIITECDEVCDAITAVRQGAIALEKPIIPKKLLTSVRQAFNEDEKCRREQAIYDSVQMRLDSLTRREHEVLELVVAGRLTKQIARQLNISMKTVEAHRSKITRKMQIESVAELVRIVTELKLFRQHATRPLGMAPSPVEYTTTH